MNQVGQIVEIVNSDTAMLKMRRMSACAKCGKCKSIGDSESQEIVVEVDNSIGAKVGDTVEVTMDNINILKATALVYVVPLIGLMLGVFVTYFILSSTKITTHIEVISGVMGIIVMLLSYLMLKVNDRKFKESKKFLPRVEKILIDLGR